MAKRRKRLTKNQKEWRKEIANLKKRIARQRKAGYDVPESIIPPKPKRVTRAALQRIKAIKAKEIKQASTYSPPEPEPAQEEDWSYEGEGNTFHDDWAIDWVFNRFMLDLAPFRAAFYDRMNSWLAELVRKHGRRAVGEMLIEGYNNGVMITYREAYDEDALAQYVAFMEANLPVTDEMRENVYEDLGL